MHCHGSRWEVWDRARHLPCSDLVSHDGVALAHYLITQFKTAMSIHDQPIIAAATAMR